MGRLRDGNEGAPGGKIGGTGKLGTDGIPIPGNGKLKLGNEGAPGGKIGGIGKLETDGIPIPGIGKLKFGKLGKLHLVTNKPVLT